MATAHPVKTVVFSLLPLALLLLLCEIVIRVTGADAPRMYTKGFTATEFARYDPELLWSLIPGTRRTDKNGAVYTINSLGLRCAEIASRQEGELRILSLGESTTFGIGVADNQTYSARLEQELNSSRTDRRYRVINAGMSAYSSTQSVRYLERRGMALQPDAVLFYHEANDYLPTTIRDLGNNEIGITMTDAQLLASLPFRLNGLLFRFSALYRFCFLRYVRYKITAFNWNDFQSPFGQIGLSDLSLALPTILDRETQTAVSRGGNVYFRRVSDDERLENFKKVAALCTARRIRLVVMHPSYRHSQRHTCMLTDFCKKNNIPLFEAFDSLHPSNSTAAPSVEAQSFYLDEFHPTAQGHERLARDLFRFISQNNLF